MHIVITGSLGHISKILTKELIHKGYRVTVISSNPDRQTAIEALGAKAAIGSIEDHRFLKTIFTGSDAVYCMMPPNQTAEPVHYGRRIGYHYAQAIRLSGVKRVIHLSSWGAQLDKGTGYILGAHEVEKKLDELASISLTHLRPTSFYYNLLNFIPMIKRAGFIAANYGGNDKLVLVAPEDIATAVVDEIATPATDRKIRYVSSDERTCRETAQVLGAAIGKPDLEWRTLTDEEMQLGLEAGGVPPFIAGRLVEIGASSRNGALRKDYDLHRPVMGRVKLEDFTREFAEIYHSKG